MSFAPLFVLLLAAALCFVTVAAVEGEEAKAAHR
jgi:hypothetical protein